MVSAAEIRLERFRKLKAEREKLELANKVLRGELVDRGEIEALFWGAAQSVRQAINGAAGMSRDEKDDLLRALSGTRIRVVATAGVNGNELRNEVEAKRSHRKRGRPKGSKTKASSAPARA
jgi:hypothetical protein